MRLVLLFFLMMFPIVPVCAQTQILAQVNEDIITKRDFEQRLKLLSITNGIDTASRDIRDKLLNQMVDERLKRQEAARLEVTVSKAEVGQALKEALKQNGLDFDTVQKKMAVKGLSADVLAEQVESDLLFVRAIRKAAGRRSEPTEAEIAAKLAELTAQTKEKQYLLSEIRLPVAADEDDGAVYGRAMQLIMQMRDGANFENLASKFSQSPSAAQGGFIGWVAESALDDAAREELELMQAGQLSSPVRVKRAYLILALRAVRSPEQMKEQDAVRLVQLFLPDGFQKRAQVLRELTLTKGACNQFAGLSERLDTTPRVRLGTVPLSELPPPIAAAVQKTPLQHPTAPIKIDGGELILMPCAFEKLSPLPSKEAIKARLETRALETAAARRMRELRREAVTEIRQ